MNCLKPAFYIPFCVLLSTSMTAAQAQATEFQERYDAIDAAFVGRDVPAKGRLSLSLAESLYREHPNDFGAAWRYARAAYWIAELAKDDKIKGELGKKGWEAGLVAEKLKPGAIEGPYWAAAALAQYGLSMGVLSALTKGLGGKYERLCKTAIDLDKTFDRGGPLRAFGRYYFELPWPKRDLKRSRKLLQEAVQLGPKNIRNHAYLADTYDALGEKELAKKHYETCASVDPKADDLADGLIFQSYCLEVLGLVPK